MSALYAAPDTIGDTLLAEYQARARTAETQLAALVDRLQDLLEARSQDGAGPATRTEITRLTKENAALNAELAALKQGASSSSGGTCLNLAWEEVHIEDFQALRGIKLRRRFDRTTIDELHALGRGAQQVGLKRHGSDTHWKYYLQASGFAHVRNPALVKCLRSVMEEVDACEWGLLGRAENVTVRLLEYHTYIEGGDLTKGFEKHYDGGSYLTMVVMLSDPSGDFEGGRLVVSATDWETTKNEKYVDVNFENPGDCVVFPSHKYHNVTMVTKGLRNVAVMELWGMHQGHEDARPSSLVLLRNETDENNPFVMQ